MRGVIKKIYITRFVRYRQGSAAPHIASNNVTETLV